MTAPLWMDPEEQRFPTLDRDLDVDLVVIGAGFSGLGAAWAAVRRGATVAVLEERTVASGASGRNAGFVLDGPAMGFSASVEAIGREETLEIWRLTRENHALLLSILDDLGTDCGYLRRGSMSLAATEAEWEDVQAECSRMRDAGIDVCLVPPAALPRPYDRMYCGAVYHAGNAEIEPGVYLRALAGRLAPGVQIFERSPVLSLHSDGAVEVRTAGSTVRAQSVVVATNAYTPTLLPEVPIAATRGQVVSTLPLGRVVVPFPMYADRGFQYWRQTSNGRMVVGGWRNLAMDDEVGREEALHTGIQGTLREFVTQVAPEARVERQWAGIMGFTPDHFPLVGPVPGRRRVFLAAGYSGHGVAMALKCGTLAADAAAGRGVRVPPAFLPGRFSSTM